jgi:hypothetical protein
MFNEILVYPQLKSSLKQASIRKKLGFSIFLVVVIIIMIILFHFIISLFIYESKIEILTSEINNKEFSNIFYQVSVKVVLYNPGRPQGTTVWVEITDQPTDVSFSKTQYVNLGFRE